MAEPAHPITDNQPPAPTANAGPTSSSAASPAPQTGTTERRRKPNRLTGNARIDKAIEDHIARIVADAPPLSPEQRRRIAELFAYKSPQ